MKTILVADPDHHITSTLESMLQAESYRVTSCNDGDFLLHHAGSNDFDLIVVNCRVIASGCANPLPALESAQPGAVFMLIMEADQICRHKSSRIVYLIRKPIDFPHVVGLIRELFAGENLLINIGSACLTDQIRRLCLSGATKAILVKKDRRQGIILIENGRVIYADTVEGKGEPAFLDILSWQEGRIKEIKVKKFPLPNIHKDAGQLLLEASRISGEQAPGQTRETCVCDIKGPGDLQTEPNTQPAPDRTANAKAANSSRRFLWWRHLGKGIACLAVLLVGLSSLPKF